MRSQIIFIILNIDADIRYENSISSFGRISTDPFSNASWMSSTTTFGSDFARDRVFRNLKKLLNCSHLKTSLWQAKLELIVNKSFNSCRRESFQAREMKKCSNNHSELNQNKLKKD